MSSKSKPIQSSKSTAKSTVTSTKSTVASTKSTVTSTKSTVTPTKPTKQAKTLTVEEEYTHKTDHQHVLDLPDTYIGGIEEDDIKMWVYDEVLKRIIFKLIKYIPGLYKIFDEIIVNARDQSIKDGTCNKIRVNIDKTTGTITVYNNGNKCIPIQIHKELNVYVPEMIFGMLRTSGNYDQKGKITGGKNGIGAKATNIYSSKFIVEIMDTVNKKKYTQTFSDNMFTKEDPIIEPIQGKQEGYTKITFTPDYKRFGVDRLTEDMYNLFQKRIYDLAAVTKTKVYLNDQLIEFKDFSDYIKMFYEDGEIPSPPVYEIVNDRWKVAVVFDSNAGFKQISYVNGICTFQGGSHVTHVMDQVVTELNKIISAKNKNLKIKSSTIKDNLTVFIDCVIEDPGFNSQSKEQLTTKVANFGSKCELTEDFIKRLSKTGIIDEVVNFAKFRAMEDLKKTDGTKKPNLKGLVKLDDAQWAGTRKAKFCRLILTEGDSAKSFAVDGTEIIGKEQYGIFPLKGKLLNVREATPKQLMDNEEIKNIKQIMGLKHGKIYKDVNQLRYGGIIILTDQDYDGSHIKGLLINFIHYFWPSLLINVDNFIQTLKTPIVKVWKKTDVKKQHEIIFYTITEYKDWRQDIGEKINLWNIKYYKGLGTSKENEAKDAFRDFDKKIISYIWNQPKVEDGNNEEIDNENGDDDEADENSVTEQSVDDTDNEEIDNLDKSNECYDAITLGFAKNRVIDRKIWLKNYNKDIILDNNQQQISYYDFINKDLIHFSNYDNIRSLPSICDGFKPSQRKILYGSILKKIFKEEIKVAQLAGFISDKAAYHHGEASLQGAIIAMAQNYVGANNLNLLNPNGNFGKRRAGGKDAASPRYIYTQLNELTPLIFRKEDDCIYDYVDEDGDLVEPITYHPIVPMILVNGSEGIGTGFSTDIPCYNIKDIINNIILLIKGGKILHMFPWYRGFTGQIRKQNEKSYKSVGIFEIIDENTILIEELPIGFWTESYITFLDTLIPDDPKDPKKGQILRKYINDSGNNTVKITLEFFNGVVHEMVKKNEVEERLKLTKTHSLTNMHLYDTTGVIKKYESIDEILEEYYVNRLDVYEKRKAHYLILLENQLKMLEWRIKFLEYVISGKITVFENKKAKKKSDVIQTVEELGFPKLSTHIDALEDDKNYNYITNLPLFSLTDEELALLKNEYAGKMNEYNIYKETSVKKIWLGELTELSTAYDKWLLVQNDSDENNKKKGGKVSKGKGKVQKATVDTQIIVKAKPSVKKAPVKKAAVKKTAIKIKTE